MATEESIARCLASAMVAGRWEVDELAARGEDALGKRWRWLRPLAGRLAERFGEQRRPSCLRVQRFILHDAGFARACEKHDISIGGLSRKRPVMAPSAGKPASWSIPPLVTPGELAQWLDLASNELDWFADRRCLERGVAAGRLRHYRYYWLSKRLAGTARLIEAPKWRLKSIQKRILHAILDNIPPHAAAHGFCRGKSIQGFVAPHVGQQIVLRLDLRDFFPSVARARVAGMFRVAGYPEEVAQLLAAVCTNQVPNDVWRHFPQFGGAGDRFRHEALYCRPHLPQGAPTSPAVANLCALHLDCRLAGLARSVDAQYTRYADDLLFSGEDALDRSIRGFRATVGAIAKEEGFDVNTRKTRIMRQGRRQHAAGLVINQITNTPRDEFDRLKATLYNCVRLGPASQNRNALSDFRSHLEGRVAHVESVNSSRGKRLRRLLDRVQWR